MFRILIFPAVGLFRRVVHPTFQGMDKNNAQGAIHQVRTKTADRICSQPSCPNEMGFGICARCSTFAAEKRWTTGDRKR